MVKETCSSCEQMKKENKLVRNALTETNSNYVEVVNENLALKKEIEELRSKIDQLKKGNNNA